MYVDRGRPYSRRLYYPAVVPSLAELIPRSRSVLCSTRERSGPRIYYKRRVWVRSTVLENARADGHSRIRSAQASGNLFTCIVFMALVFDAAEQPTENIRVRRTPGAPYPHPFLHILSAHSWHRHRLFFPTGKCRG